MASTFAWGGNTWGPKDRVAFSLWLKKRGKSLSGWSSSHPDIAKSVFGITPPKTLMGVAQDQANQLIAPELAATEAERARAQTSSKNLIANSQGFDAALAKLLGGIAPTVGAGYQAGAGEIGSLAKGFADANVAQAAGENASQGAFLRDVAHAPDAQIAGVAAQRGGAGMGDVTYGLGGYIPASTMAREGAAFTAEAAGLPAEAAGLGQMNSNILARKAMETDQKYADDLATIKAKLPGLTTQAYNAILSAQRQQEAQDIQRQYLGLSGRKTEASLTGVDPVTGQPTYQSTKDAAAARAKQASADAKAAKDRGAAVTARNNAYGQARKNLFTEVRGKSFSKPMTLDDQIAWVAAHPGKKLADAPKVHRTDYVTAKKTLFNEYKYLLQYGTRSSQAKLKRQLNQMIDEALASVDIVPGKKPLKRYNPPGQIPRRGPQPGTGPR